MKKRVSQALIGTLAVTSLAAIAAPQVAYAKKCTTRPVSVSLKPASAVIQPGGTVRYQLKVTNGDSRGCAASDFELRASSSGNVDWMVLPNNYEWATLRPQSSRTFTVQAWAGSDLGPGVYKGTVWVDDRDASKRGHGGSAPIQAVIR